MITIWKKMCWNHQFCLAKDIVQNVKSCISRGEKRAGTYKLVSGGGRSHIILFACTLLLTQKTPILILTDRNDMRDKLFSLFESNKNYLLRGTEVVKVSGSKNLIEGFKFESIRIFVVNTASFRCIAKPFYEKKIICFFYELSEKSLTDIEWISYIIPKSTFVQISSDKRRNSEEMFDEVFEGYQISDCEKNKQTIIWDYEDRSRRGTLVTGQNFYDKATEVELIVRSKEIAKDILEHYENRLKSGNTTQKAIIIAHNRRCAKEIYLAIREANPDWFSPITNKESKVHLIMPRGDYEEQIYWYSDRGIKKAIDMSEVIGSDDIREQLKSRFAIKNSMFKIAIVVGLLTKGITYELLDTIYLDQELSISELKQIISRVNRNSENKTNALIVSYNTNMSQELKNLKQLHKQ